MPGCRTLEVRRASECPWGGGSTAALYGGPASVPECQTCRMSLDHDYSWTEGNPAGKQGSHGYELEKGVSERFASFPRVWVTSPPPPSLWLMAPSCSSVYCTALLLSPACCLMLPGLAALWFCNLTLHHSARLLLGIHRSLETHLKHLIFIWFCVKEIEHNSIISLKSWVFNVCMMNVPLKITTEPLGVMSMSRLMVRFEKLCSAQQGHKAH